MQPHRLLSPTREDMIWAVARDVGGGSHGRRKEVALGRLKSVSLILILGAWGGASDGASLDDAAASPATATRQAPPAPPIKYLEAGARLFNSAQNAKQMDLASKYLEAANTYRDQLQPDEQATLDAYLKELSKAKARHGHELGGGRGFQGGRPGGDRRRTGEPVRRQSGREQ